MRANITAEMNGSVCVSGNSKINPPRIGVII